MERTDIAEEKVLERLSVSMRADDGSSSSMQMDVEAKTMLEPEQPEEKVVKGSALAEKQGTREGKESMGVNEEHDSSSSRVAETMQLFEDETSSRSWKQMVDLAEALQIRDTMILNKADMERYWMRPSIYRVLDWLKSMTKAEAYRPQVVSLGPFHHGEQSLQPMEEHKRRLMRHMVERSKKPLAMFVEAITQVAGELQDAYYGLDVGWRGHNTARFVDVMVTDAGFLLELMTTVESLKKREMVLDYARYDPIFSERSLLCLWARLRSDMILVENQVPLLALQKLEAVRSGTSAISYAYINQLVNDFICPDPDGIRNHEKLGLHTLEVFHIWFCGGRSQHPKHKDKGRETTMLSAEELREAGVHFKRSENRSVEAIDFKNGVLSMPLVEIDDNSERTFLNLMAFERLHSDAGSVATDYMIFMDNIIDSERDVALLRSKKVIKNFLSSDKAAADLFNTVAKGASLSRGSNVGRVQQLVAMHCGRAWPRLQASFRHTYLRNPWVFSAVAATILLVLTILQTAYTVAPYYYTKN